MEILLLEKGERMKILLRTGYLISWEGRPGVIHMDKGEKGILAKLHAVL